MTIQIEVEELSKHFVRNIKIASYTSEEASDEVKALDNVSFQLKAGDRLGIIGSNGAGKSTLLSLLAGLAKPSSGKLKIDGHVTAIMTLGLGLKEDVSGRENIYIDGEIQGKTRAEINKIIDEVIAFSELGEFIDYPVRTYSTGMKARLAFSMIVTIDPEILIIDEALSVGDVNFSQKATKKIMEICDRGKIVIIVSHGMSSIVDMCNRCFWMEQGKIIMDGEPALVTEAYLDAVHRKDEKQLIDKFQIQKEVTLKDCRIIRLDLHRIHQISPQVIYYTGEDLNIHLEIALGKLKEAMIKLIITRLDGLKITELSRMIVADSANKIFDICLSQLTLAWGIYKVKIQVLEDALVVAERSAIFEVKTLNPPSGGRPVLIYPANVSVKSHYREQPCLDLTNTILD